MQLAWQNVSRWSGLAESVILNVLPQNASRRGGDPPSAQAAFCSESDLKDSTCLLSPGLHCEVPCGHTSWDVAGGRMVLVAKVLEVGPSLLVPNSFLVHVWSQELSWRVTDSRRDSKGGASTASAASPTCFPVSQHRTPRAKCRGGDLGFS